MGPEQKKDRDDDGDEWGGSLPKVPGGDGADVMPSQHRKLTEAEIAAEEERTRQFRDATGISSHVYKNESLAPPVDMELVRAYVEHQLPDDEMERVLNLMIGFKSWHNAEIEVLVATTLEQSAQEDERRKGERERGELN